MELQFEQANIQHLCRTAWGAKTVEETGEIRLPDQEKMPLAVLGSWGQPLLLEKEWSGDTVSVSGGVNVWVLLRYKDEADVQCVEGWVPFRQTWELKESRRDGKLNVQCALQGVDARMTGAGKLIITVQVCVALQALEPCETPSYIRGQLPEDIYMREENVSVTVPMEAGEKRTSLEEDMIIPPGKPDVDRVLYYKIEPAVFERKLMGDKLVFRGAVKLHMVYKGKDGEVCACDGEFPVSQYAQLDGEYGSAAMADVYPAVTSAEVYASQDGRAALRCGVLWQYLVHDDAQLSVPMDAYSNVRKVEVAANERQIPALSGREEGALHAACVFDTETDRLVDHAVMASGCIYNDKNGELEAEGTARLLYYDGDGMLQSMAATWSAAAERPMDGCRCIEAGMKPSTGEVTHEDGHTTLQITFPYSVHAVCERSITGLSSLAVSDEPAEKGNRPSLILRRADGNSLWQLAKVCGSSEKAILESNGIDAVTDNRMLLIPVE